MCRTGFIRANFDPGPTWVEQHRSLQVSVLLRADVHAPALLQETFDGFDVHHGHPDRRPALAAPRVALPLGQTREDALQHAGLHRLRRLKVHAVLRESQHEQGRPAAADEQQLVVLRQLAEARHVFHEAQRLDQHGRRGFAGDLRGAQDAAAPRGAAGARLLLLLLPPELPQRGWGGGGGGGGGAGGLLE